MIALISAASLFAGRCTTMRVVPEPHDVIVEQLRAGSLLKAGDRIRVVLTDRRGHQDLRVVEIRPDGTIVRGNSEIRVDEFVSLEKRERSWVKTGVLLGVLGLALVCCFAPRTDPGFASKNDPPTFGQVHERQPSTPGLAGSALAVQS